MAGTDRDGGRDVRMRSPILVLSPGDRPNSEHNVSEAIRAAIQRACACSILSGKVAGICYGSRVPKTSHACHAKTCTSDG